MSLGCTHRTARKLLSVVGAIEQILYLLLPPKANDFCKFFDGVFLTFLSLVVAPTSKSLKVPCSLTAKLSINKSERTIFSQCTVDKNMYKQLTEGEFLAIYF